MTVTEQVGFRSERGRVLISLMLSSFLVAIDSTIVATAVPTVVDDLGGFSQFPWLFSVYLLAQAVSVPLYGKLADLYGRKPVVLFGIGVFLLGSILCGLAWSMLALIVFRAIQGLGAGAVQPTTVTIVGDTYTVQERGKVQGYLASVWATSSVVGPALGGVFAEYLSWRWIFLINIPLCAIAATMLIRNFHERVTRRSPTLDYPGAALLAVGCVLLVLGLLEGGVTWAWASPVSFGVLGTGAILLVSFVFVERRSVEPVLPLWVFRRRMQITANLVSFSIGATLLGLTSYVPTFVQSVIGAGPLVAGFALSSLTFGWPLTASQSSKLSLRIGFRNTATMGGVVTVLGTAIIALLDADATIVLVGAGCFIVGAGLGLIAAPTIVATQASVGWSERGVVTASNLFSRSIGSAVGVAVFGAIANTALDSSQSPAAVAAASHHVFIAVAVAAVMLMFAILSLPASIPTQSATAPA